MYSFTPKLSLNLDRLVGPERLADQNSVIDQPAAPSRVTARPAGYYHVILSGNRRKVLFSTVDDRRALNAIAIEVLERFDAKLHAYCLMPNHFRALVQIDDRLLVKALRRIATQYSRHRQRHLKSTLHLFERPYTAQRVDTDGDFLALLRHIHLAPVIGNKVVAPDDYLWSSHRAYLGYKSVTRITTEFGLSLLAASPVQARVVYHQFVAAGLADNVARTASSKPRSVRMNAIGAEIDSPVAPLLEASLEQTISTALIDSRNPLPGQSESVFPRFSLSSKRLRLRRFVAIY